MWIDSHVNLHADAFKDDLEAVIERARAAGIGRFVAICDRWSSLPAIRSIVNAHADMVYSVGAHPHYAKDHTDLTAAMMVEAAADPRVAAIGETGLDLHYGFSPIEDQTRLFRAHIEAARQTGLPLIIHTREADELTAAIVEEEMARGAFLPLLHCFTAGLDLLERVLALGGYVSFSGILTFKNAHDVREAAKASPEDRIILETDCPYLAPAPHRGRRCEPAMLSDTARVLAELKGWSLEECEARTTENCLRLFERARDPAPRAPER